MALSWSSSWLPSSRSAYRRMLEEDRAHSQDSAPQLATEVPLAPPSGSATAGWGPSPSIPPVSTPGWGLDAIPESLPRAHGPLRQRGGRAAPAVLGLAAIVMLAAAFVIQARGASQEQVAAPAAPAGITLDDVVVDGALRLPDGDLTVDAALGFNECFMPDPLGLGPYAPYRIVQGPVLARVAIPQQGGHTADYGFDVVVHFHGGEAVRKRLVQTVSGAVFVAVDLGDGSGPYADGLAAPERWRYVRAEITRALREHTGDARAHIRHLALTSWSAGYGAVNQILKVHGDADVDAVVLLDSMHVGQNLIRPRNDGSLESLSAEPLRALFDFATKAVKGEKTFVLTHSNIVPEGGYASVRRSADLLLHELGLERTPQERRVGLMDQLTTVDVGRFHVWGFAGRYEKAHCAHTTLLGPIISELLEPLWETPAMNRDVSPTPAPVLGNRR